MMQEPKMPASRVTHALAPAALAAVLGGGPKSVTATAAAGGLIGHYRNKFYQRGLRKHKDAVISELYKGAHMLTELGFHKQAAEKIEEEVDAALGPAVVGSLAGLGLSTGANAAIIPLFKHKDPTPEVSKSVRRYIEKHKLQDVPIYTGRDAATTAFIPNHANYSRPGVHVENAAQEGIFLHELGHAKDMKKWVKPKMIGQVAGQLGSLASPIIGMTAATKIDNPYVAGGVTLAPSLPVLRNEAVASLSATKHLIGQHGLRKGLLKAVPLLAAYSTYAGLPVGSSIGAFIGSRNRVREEQGL